MRLAALLVLSFGGFAACSQSDDSTVAEVVKAPWAEFAARTVAEYYRRNPERGVNAGLHQYDGQIRDLSPESVAHNSEASTTIACRARWQRCPSYC